MAETLPDMQAIGKSIKEDKAPIKSPVFTGTPQVPDVAAGDSSKKAANTSFVAAAVAALEAEITTALSELIEEYGGTVPTD